VEGERNIARAEGNPDGGAITGPSIHEIRDFLMAGIIASKNVDRTGDGIGEASAAVELGIGFQILADSV
jgi:hypothetical protein